MNTIEKTVPTGARKSDKFRTYILFNSSDLRIFGVPNVPNHSTCTAKNHTKSWRGCCLIADLVRLATFQIPAVFPQVSILHLNMSPNMQNHTPEQRLEQLLLTLKQNSQAYTDLAANLLPPDNTHPSLVQFDKPFPLACKSVFYAN